MQTKPSVTSQARRLQIVEAATRVIAREGLSKAAFTRIAMEAGLSSPGMISYHFADKDELFAVLADRHVTDLAGALVSATDGAPDAKAALAAYLNAFIGWQDTNRDAVGALWRLASGWKAPGRDQAFDEEPLVAPLLRVLDDGVASGVLRDVRAGWVAHTILCAVEGFHEVIAANPDLTADAYAAELIALFVGGLEVR